MSPAGLYGAAPHYQGVEFPRIWQGQLTSDGALEGAVVVKGNDGDLIGLRA